MSMTVTKNIQVTILVDSQASVQNLEAAVDYAINNSTGFTSDQHTELSTLRTDLLAALE